ncbi:MAG: carboxylating nicotinate-nucleotide diphosphorylase [Gammaproteobacteria bacterium]|nr:carboxylating nicotinate-nucleotide diphosphorylase [Gammaproteobacteria bacterium]
MLDVDVVLEEVVHALKEDVGPEDITAALIPHHACGSAVILSREPMTVCGIPWVNQVFQVIDSKIKIHWQVAEGDVLSEPMILARLTGSVRGILTAERTALNFLQTLSGVATETRRYVLNLEGTQAKLLDTRKTLPGLRQALKYAVTWGGGVNHRMGLFDAVLIKENHIKACGSIQNAVEIARQRGLGQWIEVEVESLDEFQVALNALPDRILLDNFDNQMLREAVLLRADKNIILEASGGVNLSSITAIAETGVDYISVGAITKSVRAIDLSLLLDDTA